MFEWLRRLIDRNRTAEAVGGPLDGQRLLTSRTPWSCVHAVARIGLDHGFIEAGEFAAATSEQAMGWREEDLARIPGTYHLLDGTFVWSASGSKYLTSTQSQWSEWRRSGGAS